MGSIKKRNDFIEVRITPEELIAMPFQIASGYWNVSSAIARACVEKVQEKAAAHQELAGLEFDMYKVKAGEGEFVVHLRIRQENKNPLAGVY